MEEIHFGPVWVLPGENRGRYPYCHSLYVEGAGVLIDPASDRARLKRLRDENGVREIWLSHWHEDHFTHIDLFDGIPLKIAKPDAAPLAGLEPFLDAYGMDEAYRLDWRPLLNELFHFRPRKPDGFLAPNARIDLGATRVRIIPAPGHTPGHTALLFEDPNLLFLADYDLSKFGPWYGDRDSDIDDTIASVARLRQLPAEIWITAHETGIFREPPGPLWDRYLGVIRTREEKLLELLQTPRTLEEIAGACIIYRKPREPKHFFEFGEKAHMRKHLEHLAGQGRVTVLPGNRFALTRSRD